MFLAFPKEFFSLGLNFASNIYTHFDTSYHDALYLYTPFYVRLIGFSDESPPRVNETAWQNIINNLPEKKYNQIDYFYEKYKLYEKHKKLANNQIRYGCFSYTYHKNENWIELHFINADKKGNLSQERIQARNKELTSMFTSIKLLKASDVKIHIHTWLLNIHSFTRLFPEQFIASTKDWNKNIAQDNTHWGQFVDKSGNLKKNLAKQLILNSKSKRTHINDYFPLRAKYAESSQEVFFKHFSID